MIKINDKGLSYTEVLFKARKNYSFNAFDKKPNVLFFDGYSFRFNALRFGDTWYVD